MATEHTPEPWISEGSFIGIPNGKGTFYMSPLSGINQERREADARRIVACVNACAGLSTGFLEQIDSIQSALTGQLVVTEVLENQRDELLAAKGKVSVTLTGKEIREIAELAGLQFVEHDYTDEYETEIAIESCPDKGIMNDDNAPEHYRLIAFLNEYPEEGCIGLGEKIEAAAIASVKGGQA